MTSRNPLLNRVCSYSIDLYGTKAILPYAAQGLGIYVALSTMDKYWYPDITRDEAVELLRKCIAEVKLRELTRRRKWDSTDTAV